jgi:hypothetical protein
MAMPADVNFDVEISDVETDQQFMKGARLASESAGARYQARGGSHTVYKGDWQPRRRGQRPRAAARALQGQAVRPGRPTAPPPIAGGSL